MRRRSFGEGTLRFSVALIFLSKTYVKMTRNNNAINVIIEKNFVEIFR